MFIYQDNCGTICVAWEKLKDTKMEYLGEAHNYEEFSKIMRGDECFMHNYIGEISNAFRLAPKPEGFDPEHLTEEDKRDILQALDYLKTEVEQQ